MFQLLLSPALLLASITVADGPFVDLTFDEACKKAKDSEKVVMIDFFTTWCGPCKKLDATTWKDDKVVTWLDEHTVALKIDAEKEVELAKRFNVDAYPTMVFVEPSGDLKARVIGYKDPAAFLSAAEDAMVGVKPSDRLRKELAKDPTNPMFKKSLAVQLLREGDQGEALELLLWCWDHGAEPPHQSFSGVRGSFLLSDLKRLAAKYKPAKLALVERRDAAEALLIDGAAARGLTRDFIRLNEALGDTANTLEAYDTLKAKADEEIVPLPTDRERSLQELFEAVMPMLLRAKRYEEVVEGLGDPITWLDRKVQRCKAISVHSKELDPSFSDHLRKSTVDEANLVYIALLGDGNHDAIAAHFTEKLLEFAPGLDTWKTLIRSAEKMERKEVADGLRTKAQKVLPEKDLNRLGRRRGK